MATRSGTIGTVRRSKRARRKTQAAQARVPLTMGHPARLLTLATFALLFLGTIMILSASSVSSFAQYGSSFWFFKRQLIWVAFGVVAFLFFSRLDYHRLRGFGYVMLAASIGMLVVVLIPGLGETVGGSSRWFRLGALSFQPSEFAKLALVMFGADVFSRKNEKTLSDFGHTAVPMLPVLAVLALLVMMQPDMGTTLLLGAIGFGILFTAGAPLRYLVPVGVVGLAGSIAFALGEEYRRARIFAFFDPWADPYNTGYQTIQGLLALGSGGWFGVGLGASRQKWSYIPNAHTDYIFSIIGEEMGLIGTFVVLGLFAFLAYLGIRTARQAPDRYGMFLATGVTVWIGVQALVNMGAVTAALPMTGVPLPLVSAGGSSLLTTLIAMGILRNVALQGKR